ncbi:MAG: hypothetical protein WDZ59_08045 [Pirellulales bacterium]
MVRAILSWAGVVAATALSGCAMCEDCTDHGPPVIMHGGHYPSGGRMASTLTEGAALDEAVVEESQVDDYYGEEVPAEFE